MTAPPPIAAPPAIPIAPAFQRRDDLELIELPIRDGPTLYLRRRRGAERGGKPVLLIHGASAAGDTFLIPEGTSLVDFLGEKGFDVWILDWTGSLHITAGQPAAANRSADEVARTDFPRALQTVWKRRQDEGASPKLISVVAHCMGAACFSMAVGAGWVTSDGHHVDKILLSTIGLFYEVAWDGWTKVQDRVLERCRIPAPPPLVISPDGQPGWPGPLEDVYRLWPSTWGWGPPFDTDFFRRLAFMFGEPFLTHDLAPTVTPATVREQFGAIPFTFYRQCAQNVLRGFAGTLDAEGRLPTGTTNETMNIELADPYLQGQRFVPFDRITLMTGAQNPLWHRDSVDKMAEWLVRFRREAPKYVFDGFGHQDLWWGRRSAEVVFPYVQRAI
jgi:hypothetical protein